MPERQDPLFSYPDNQEPLPGFESQSEKPRPETLHELGSEALDASM